LREVKQTIAAHWGWFVLSNFILGADLSPGPTGMTLPKRGHLLFSYHPEMWQALLISPGLDDRQPPTVTTAQPVTPSPLCPK